MSNLNDKVKRRIEEELLWNVGDRLRLGALADMEEEEGNIEKSEELRDAAEIGEEVLHLQRFKKELQKQMILKISELDGKISSLRKKCKHPITHWEPDASGNNDDSETCLCCGKDL